MTIISYSAKLRTLLLTDAITMSKGGEGVESSVITILETDLDLCNASGGSPWLAQLTNPR
jgi:hypothetical protein